ncbi:tRNA lysidine(34) synthetase TilS [Paenibacillus hodogayensis]
MVAVSGGPDSMALLHVLARLAAKWRFGLIAAHVNHGFRVEESREEERIVAAYADSLGIPCDIGRFDLPAYIAGSGDNAQAAAREKRYAFLHDTASRHGARAIALAHHADDQAETVLMRLLRGTGPSGLAGMAMKRSEKKVELIRPFLRIYKSELERYCSVQHIPTCRDSSNEQRKYFRNAVRLDVMPFLQGYNERLPESLNRLADTMRAEDDWMEAEAHERFDKLVSVRRVEEQVQCSLDAGRFAGLHVALQRRLIKLILNYVFSEADLSDYVRIETIRNAIAKEKGRSIVLDLHERLKLVREYDHVVFMQTLPVPEHYEYAIAGTDGTLALAEAGVELQWKLIEASVPVVPTCQTEVWFDFDQLALPLKVRSRQPGDRMEPFGLKGTKKVKDMFIDEKVPPAIRHRIPLLLDAAGRIIWIPGMRRSAHATVSGRTSRILVMDACPLER